MIPKVIHYCWFGNKKKSKLIRDCILSWKYYLPDYEIIEWNERNSDLSIPFVKEAYKLKKWAFVADYIRFKVLYENGGIYLDTDVMVLKTFDHLLSNESFFGAEDEEFINGAIIGSIKRNEFIKECISFYGQIDIRNKIDFGQITIPRIITEIYRKKFNYFLPFNKKLEKGGVVVYPFSFFYPLSFNNKGDKKQYRDYLQPHSVTVHLWSESWVEYDEFQCIKKGSYFIGIKIIMKNIFFKGKIEKVYLKKIILCFKEQFFDK